MIRRTLVLFVFAALAATLPAIACTTLGKLPTVIKSPGAYCLDRDVKLDPGSATAAIEIVASGVTLDLQGYSITSTVQTSCLGGALGVYATDQLDITVRNGEITGFQTGVALITSAPSRWVNGLVEDLEVRWSGCRGIELGGAASIVRDNVISSSGGGSPESDGTGIRVGGIGNHIYGNDIQHVFPGHASEHTGIYLLSTATENLIERNRTSFVDHAIVSVDPSNRYRDNLSVATESPAYVGGTDLGGND